MMPQPRVQIFTDGSCLGNPGPGGWAAILRHPEKEKELSGGYKLTTNNRMELMAVIFALQALKRPCTIELYTDSRYVADAINKNWLVNWQGNGWKNAAKKPVKNQDLWEEVAKLLPRHDISLHWLKSHVGHPENERCDMLAKSRAAESALPPDHGFRAD